MTARPVSEDPYAGVPERPVVRLVLCDDGGGTVNGHPVDIPSGADRHAVLMTRACRIAATLGRSVRVTARDARTEWDLVAHPDGGVTPVGGGRALPRPVPPVPPVSSVPGPVPPVSSVPGPVHRPAARPGAVVWSAGKPRTLRAPSLPLLGGLVVGGLLLASMAVMTLPRQGAATSGRTVETLSAARPGTGGTGSSATARTGSSAASSPVTGLPVVGPPGFSARPSWTVPISAWTRSVAADAGTVLTRDPDGHLLLLDPRTGGVRWRSTAATTASQDGPWLTSIDGRPSAALVGDGVLSSWVLPSAGGQPAGDRLGVRLPAGATVTWVGPSPLVTSPRGGVGVIRGGRYESVALPSGARALAADGARVLAVRGTTFVQQAAGTSAARPRELPRPKGAAARPVRVEAVGTDYLLTIWPRARSRGQIAGLVETAGGKLVASTALETTLDLARAGVVREAAGTQTVLGSVLVDTYTASVNLLDPRYTVRLVSRGHAWAMFQGRATDIHLDQPGDFRTVPFPPGDVALPIGVVAGDSRTGATAVVVAPSGDGWALRGLRASSPPPSQR